MMKIRTLSAAVALVALGAASSATADDAMTLTRAAELAINTNPEIMQAIQNREAIAFEQRQARGLYLPRAWAEASAGARQLDNRSRRIADLDDHTLYPMELSLNAEWVLFDSFGRRGEVEHQAGRLDGASHRVRERAEFISLEVAREYINYGLQERLVALARENVAYHRDTVGRLQRGVTGLTISETDLQQARERLSAAERRLTEAESSRTVAVITFRRLVGLPITDYLSPDAYLETMPASLDDAIGTARENNPDMHIQQSAISAAEGRLMTARSEYLPTVSVEGRARHGEDLDTIDGETSDFQIRAVVRWEFYNGGIYQAAEQEELRRVSEERFRLHQVAREVEEQVRLSWDRLESEQSLMQVLTDQTNLSIQVVDGYERQFPTGRRSLLDILDAQNTRINVAEALAVSEHSHLFAQYRLLASMGELLNTLNLDSPSAAEADAREAIGAPDVGPGEDQYRRRP